MPRPDRLRADDVLQFLHAQGRLPETGVDDQRRFAQIIAALRASALDAAQPD